jgi:hypothetical protein
MRQNEAIYVLHFAAVLVLLAASFKQYCDMVQPIYNSYDYVDFRPFLPPWAGFEPCEIMPGGEGCECLNLGCKNAVAADSGVVSAFASPVSCEQIGAPTGDGSKKKRDLFLVCAFQAFGSLTCV